MSKIIADHKLLTELLVILVLSACTLVNQETGTTGLSDHIDWYQVYFTEPESPKASTLRGGPDADLAEAIFRARLSVEIAMDSLDLWSLREALLAAHRRGVDVRVVVETDNLTSGEVQELIANGIPVQNDRQAGLMHNK
jgi:phosphatidylserine/phosphatidylglycerophosphate/cardiolipin synthase-like enzyme